jgi:hypothetical protein
MASFSAADALSLMKTLMTRVGSALPGSVLTETAGRGEGTEGEASELQDAAEPAVSIRASERSTCATRVEWTITLPASVALTRIMQTA